MNGKHLSIYLNDHLAGAVGGLALARRTLAANQGTALGAYLEILATEIEEDRKALEELMASLEIRTSPWKGPALWLAEKVGRLKTNGSMVGYSDLSRVEELEALILGVRAKLLLWRGLEELAPRTIKAERAELAALAERAEHQLKTLEGHQLDAARVALGDEQLPRDRGDMTEVPVD